ncbi:multiple sugar transport system substrate-binding protein [Nakamurella sp. UYEF19]|uniref:extracellular solute-binding protein n=1 Tax=Nakamurella sp. UYEF19 TaxID=1756392 RepID=UPI003394BFDE
MRNIRKIGVAAMAAAMVLTVASCSSSSSGSAAPSKELSVWIPSDDSGRVAAYIAAFNTSHPGYTVTLRQIPFAQYDNALGQAFRAGQGPDIAQINGTTFPSFASKGYLQPIVPIVGDTGELATANFYPNLYQAAAFDGKQLSLPIDTGTRVMQYNKKLLAKAGVAPFGETTSYADLLSAAQKVRALGDKYQGFCYVGGDKWYTVNSNAGPFVIQSGGAFMNKEQTKATLDTPEAEAGFNFFKSMAATGDKSNLVATASSTCVEGFGAGTVGMQFDGFWDIPSKDKASATDFELGQTMPKDKTTYSSTGGWVLGVPTYVKSDKFDVLKTFVNDMYAPKNIVQFTGLMPATKSGRDAATALKAPQYDIYWKILNENANNPIPLNANLVAQANLLMSTMQSVIQGTQSTKAALAQAQTAFDATLTK